MHEDFKWNGTIATKKNVTNKDDLRLLCDVVEKAVVDECNEIRFKFKNYPDMFAMFYICGIDGDYYLSIGYDYDVENDIEYLWWHKIKPEYVDLLTSAISDAE